MPKTTRGNKVSPTVREAVLLRDRVCFLYRINKAHKCFDTYGNPHAPDDTNRLSLDHVKDEAMLGKKARSDVEHLVALCGAANVKGVSRESRQLQRAYLRRVNG